MATNEYLIASALEKTNPTLADEIDARNSFAPLVKMRGLRVAKYRNYERGDHDADLTEQMRDMLRLKEDGSGLKEFNDNYCGIVIDKMASRVHVAEITADDDAGTQWISDMLERNDWEALEGQTVRAAIRDGDAYIMVDPQTMQWSAEPAYDGYSGIVAIFDSLTRKPMWACKLWTETEKAEGKSERVVNVIVYQEEQISYWTGTEGGTDVAETEAAVAWGRDIPLALFANQLDNYTNHGDSEIRKAIPLQDALNRTLHSMIMASEFSAFGLRYAIGMDMDVSGITPGAVVNMSLRDSAGNPITELTEEQVRLLAAIKVGQLEATDMTQFTNQIQKLVEEISQATQTPIYGITTTGQLSGEALKQLEIGLLGKVYRFQRDNSRSVRRLLEITAQIQQDVENSIPGDAPILGGISVNWKNPEIVDVSEQIKVLADMRSKAPGLWPDEWYRERIGGLLGMTQTQITEEGAKAQNSQADMFASLVGANGGAVA